MRRPWINPRSRTLASHRLPPQVSLVCAAAPVHWTCVPLLVPDSAQLQRCQGRPCLDSIPPAPRPHLHAHIPFPQLRGPGRELAPHLLLVAAWPAFTLHQAQPLRRRSRHSELPVAAASPQAQGNLCWEGPTPILVISRGLCIPPSSSSCPMRRYPLPVGSTASQGLVGQFW